MPVKLSEDYSKKQFLRIDITPLKLPSLVQRTAIESPRLQKLRMLKRENGSPEISFPKDERRTML